MEVLPAGFSGRRSPTKSYHIGMKINNPTLAFRSSLVGRLERGALPVRAIRKADTHPNASARHQPGTLHWNCPSRIRFDGVGSDEEHFRRTAPLHFQTPFAGR